MKKIAVILSGSGVYDGSELHESVLTLLAIEQQNASYRCFAPNIEQHHVINHLTGEVAENESRNVLVESARIARGDIEDLSELDVASYDALILPGGFGAAKNLSDFALSNGEYEVNKEVLNACKDFANADKPVGYMCIAPVIAPFVNKEGVKITIGNDKSIAETLTKLGAEHQDCVVSDIVIDPANKVVTTPAYMLAENISEAAEGIGKLVKAVVLFA